MSKHILDNLFESKAKVKILKYIFRNPEKEFSVKELASKVQENQETVYSELIKLTHIQLLEEKK
jgi:hypothetical protein